MAMISTKRKKKRKRELVYLTSVRTVLAEADLTRQRWPKSGKGRRSPGGTSFCSSALCDCGTHPFPPILISFSRTEQSNHRTARRCFPPPPHPVPGLLLRRPLHPTYLQARPPCSLQLAPPASANRIVGTSRDLVATRPCSSRRRHSIRTAAMPRS
jgi:hypothetical protein